MPSDQQNDDVSVGNIVPFRARQTARSHCLTGGNVVAFPDVGATRRAEVRELARAAIIRKIAGLFDPAEMDVFHALEWAAAEVAASPEVLVDVVTELAPDAAEDEGREHLLLLARFALRDFEAIRRRRASRKAVA